MNVPWQIVIASADLEDRRAMVNILAKQGLDPIVASSVGQCRASMAQEDVGLIFCARSLSDGDYRDLLTAAVPAHAGRGSSSPLVSPIGTITWSRSGWASSTSSQRPAVRATWNG
jgi:hypothetical protein